MSVELGDTLDDIAKGGYLIKVDATEGESQPSTIHLIKANAMKRTILIFISGLPIPSEYIFHVASDDDEARK